MAMKDVTSHENEKVADVFGIDSVHARFITPTLFTLAILLSAGLLFFVQPLLTRLVTPLAGGAPGVWTTAMLFFQVTMIAGYLYAHLLTRLPRLRHQIGLHLMIWLIASSFLPLQVPQGWQLDLSAPIQTQTLLLYASTIGLPFFFLSANAPLIQTWYGRTMGPSANDPYFLYGASNVGSLVALLGFPLIAEPFFGLSAISSGWSAGFIILGLLLFISVFWTTRDYPDAKTVLPILDRRSDMRMLFTWGAVAFVPSSLMLALTTRITVDFGSFPLLWILPLAVYLMTYVGGFQARPLLADTIMNWLYPFAIAVIAVLGMTGFLWPISFVTAGVMILAFSLIALNLHRALYRLRPDPSRLTVFYLTIAIGGAAGGIFNAIIAPSLMNGMHEFPLTVLAAAAVLLLISPQSASQHRQPPARQLQSWAGLAGQAVNGNHGLIICLILLAAISFKSDVFLALGSSSLTVAAILIGCMMLVFQTWMRAGIALMTAVTAAVIIASGDGLAIHAERNFFGLHRVIELGEMRVYVNGTTIHGAVSTSEPGPPEPLYYYRPDGPLADIAGSRAWREADRIGLVGLGVGSMLAYRDPAQEVTVYEIDPAVTDIALDPALFGFVHHYGAGGEIRIGDARILLERETKKRFGALLVDAYSSDSVPVHLATVEAMQVFLNHIEEGGILAFHITNRYFDMRYPLGAAAAYLGMNAYIREDPPSVSGRPGHDSTITALVVVRPGDDHPFLERDGTRWRRISVDPALAWRDDRATPLNALK